MEVVEVGVPSGDADRLRVRVESDRGFSSQLEGSKREDSAPGTHIEHPAPADLQLLQKMEDQTGRAMGPRSERGLGRDLQEQLSSRPEERAGGWHWGPAGRCEIDRPTPGPPRPDSRPTNRARGRSLPRAARPHGGATVPGRTPPSPPAADRETRRSTLGGCAHPRGSRTP